VIPSLSLGEPPDDPQKAAELWLAYIKQADGEPSQATSSMFWRMVKDPRAVQAALSELRAK
jgi:uncharacterized tellurite resistance protein B-like protein